MILCLTSLSDYRQRQECVGEQRRAEVVFLLIKQLSESSNTEPADTTQGTQSFAFISLNSCST